MKNRGEAGGPFFFFYPFLFFLFSGAFFSFSEEAPL